LTFSTVKVEHETGNIKCQLHLHMNFSFATEEDIPQLNKLVNSAYRGESSKQGWATETDLLDGQRTDEAALSDLLKQEGSIIIKCNDDQGQLIGCVHVQKRKHRMYLGMLTVSPTLQAKGLGKELMKASEEYAAQQGCITMYMTVITLRHELIQWYVRRGYHLTNRKHEFPSDPRFGIPKQPLELVVMEKHLPGILEHVSIRTELQPGDIGYVTYLHGHLYKQEYNYGISFEAYVAQGFYEFYQNYDQSKDAVWICEYKDSIVGFLLLMHRPDDAAQLRYFILKPEFRGCGLGKKLMQLFVDHLHAKKYRSAYLWTTHELPAAAALYTKHGFVLTEEKESDAFGKPLREQKYELQL